MDNNNLNQQQNINNLGTVTLPPEQPQNLNNMGTVNLPPQPNLNTPKKKSPIIPIIAIIAVIAVGAALILGLGDKKEENNNNPSNSNNTTKTTEKSRTTNQIAEQTTSRKEAGENWERERNVLKVRVDTTKKGESRTFKINNEITIKVKVDDYIYDEGIFYTVYVNDTKLASHYIYLTGIAEETEFTLDLYMPSKNTVLHSSEEPFEDVGQKLHLYQDGTTTEIYEMENVKGMIPKKYGRGENDDFYIIASRARIYSKYVYGDTIASYCPKSKYYKNDTNLLNQELTVKYTFKYENGKYNLTPEKSEIILVKDYHTEDYKCEDASWYNKEQ